MQQHTDGIIGKSLISGFEYSNYRKGTQVNIAWVRFTHGLGMFFVNMDAHMETIWISVSLI